MMSDPDASRLPAGEEKSPQRLGCSASKTFFVAYDSDQQN